MYQYDKYFVRAGACPVMKFDTVPADAVRPVVCIDESVIPGSFFGCVQWLTKDFKTEGLISHDTDELHMFIGGDPKEPEKLGCEIDFQIENDRIIFSETAFVFVPKGCAHQIISVKNLSRPVMHYIMQVDASVYRAEPAEAAVPAGTYDRNIVFKYAPVSGEIPPAPEGFLTFLLWIDGEKLPGAPYTEAVWFHQTNDTGPENHMHENLDEFVAFIGGDPEHPEELNGDVSFLIGDEQIHTTKSTLVYVPRRIPHSPLLVHALEKDMIHFSGGNGGDYNKDAVE